MHVSLNGYVAVPWNEEQVYGRRYIPISNVLEIIKKFRIRVTELYELVV